MKIGLYFGSFNPVHHGHLIIANHVLENSDMDQLWFVISPQNPLKPAAGLLNEYDRLHLVQLALEGETRLKASDIEFKLARPSYTTDTLAYLTEKYPVNEFVLVMGSDSYQNLPRWKNYEHLLKHFAIYLYLRPGFETIPQYAGLKPVLLIAPLLQISATHIRESIRAGKSIRWLVPDTVRDEIMQNRYYK